MTGFWKWCVRNAALAVAVFSLVVGRWGGVEWALALAGACVFALIAKVGDWRYEAARYAAGLAGIPVPLDRSGSIVPFPLERGARRDRAA